MHLHIIQYAYIQTYALPMLTWTHIQIHIYCLSMHIHILARSPSGKTGIQTYEQVRRKAVPLAGWMPCIPCRNMPYHAMPYLRKRLGMT